MQLSKKNTIIITVVFLIIVGGLYISLYRTSSSDCVSLPVDERNACCAAQNKDQITVSCSGSWSWDKEINECSFICDLSQEIQLCTSDVKECPDGSFVGRDGMNKCEFRVCP